ncbi:hypothetical protein MTO96_030646 [Rhipicephalus appendiculatus]
MRELFGFLRVAARRATACPARSHGVRLRLTEQGMNAMPSRRLSRLGRRGGCTRAALYRYMFAVFPHLIYLDDLCETRAAVFGQVDGSTVSA